MNEILKIKKKEVNKMRFDKERFFKDLQEKKPEVYGNDNIEIFGRFKRFTRSS